MGARGMKGPEADRGRPQGDVGGGGGGGGQEGCVSFEGGNESEAEAPRAEGKGELGNGRDASPTLLNTPLGQQGRCSSRWRMERSTCRSAMG
jgi:hypothetical protein